MRYLLRIIKVYWYTKTLKLWSIKHKALNIVGGVGAALALLYEVRIEVSFLGFCIE